MITWKFNQILGILIFESLARFDHILNIIYKQGFQIIILINNFSKI